jgi:hypothetical protein
MTRIQDQIVEMLEKRLNFNVQQRQAAFNRGDFAQVSMIDTDTAETNRMLELIRPSDN